MRDLSCNRAGLRVRISGGTAARTVSLLKEDGESYLDSCNQSLVGATVVLAFSHAGMVVGRGSG